MILFPPAKINLGLNVLFRREDGYHELDTAMVPVPLNDVLELLPASEFSFHQTGLSILGNQAENLCVKAYELLKKEFNIPPVYMHLRKEIPMGAGLGGGSADAAFVLKGLNELFALSLDDELLRSYAARLGSDCPFFIACTPQRAGGRGEVLEPVSLELKGYYLKLINPGIHVGTREAYAGIRFRKDHEAVSTVLSLPVEAWKGKLINDFESSVFDLHPILRVIKDTMYKEGAVYASMSGSGSTMYGLYAKEPSKSFRHEGFKEWILRL